jgi:DNA modification methylase
MRILIEQSTNEGEVVFEPFMGSGTTGVASVQSKRNFIGVEIDDKYFDLAEKRINNATQTLTLF